jgi:hypothetical protein
MRYSLRRLGLQAATFGIRQSLPGRLRKYHGFTTPLEQLILSSIKVYSLENLVSFARIDMVEISRQLVPYRLRIICNYVLRILHMVIT